MVKIPDVDRLEGNIAFLVDGARLLDVPVTATEQYPKGLGPTVPVLAQRLPDRLDKTTFSCCGIPSPAEGFREAGRTHIVLAGIETHVCVLNTALDLLAGGFTVFLAVDATASRYRFDRDTALRRLEQAGVVPTTCESVLFEWMRDAKHPQFKQVSALIQERMKTL